MINWTDIVDGETGLSVRTKLNNFNNSSKSILNSNTDSITNLNNSLQVLNDKNDLQDVEILSNTSKANINEGNIGNLNTRVTDVENSLGGVDLVALENEVSTNTNNIATNSSEISSNNTDISNLQTEVSSNNTDISNLDGRVGNVESQSGTNASDISDLQTVTSNNSSNITVNTNDISTNTTDINSLNSSVAVNTSDISTNTTNIATNAADIVDLQNNKVNKGIFLADNRDFNNQLPSGLDVTLQIKFGNPVSLAELDINSNGEVVIKEDGFYSFDFTLNIGRTTASGIAYLGFRILKNSVDINFPFLVKINDNDIFTIKERYKFDLNAGDKITLEMYRDSKDGNGHDSGGLYLFQSSNGWQDIPSASVKIKKI